MPRPRKDPGDLFGYEELAVASGLTRREVQQLMESKNDLVPSGRRIQTLKRIAAIGAFRSTGMPLFIAAELQKGITYDLSRSDGETPTGLNFMVWRLPKEEIAKIPADCGDYYYHLALMRGPTNTYSRAKYYKDDFIVEIVNGKAVLLYTPTFPKPELLGWIVALRRGQEAVFDNVINHLPEHTGENGEEYHAAYKSLEEEALKEREHSISRVIVNLSLAIRTALDRVYDYRDADSARKTNMPT